MNISPVYDRQVISMDGASGGRRGAIVLDVTDPDLRVVVEVGDTVDVHRGAAPDGALALHGSAVAVQKPLSIRAPLGQPVPDDQRWLVHGLADVFEEALT